MYADLKANKGKLVRHHLARIDLSQFQQLSDFFKIKVELKDTKSTNKADYIWEGVSVTHCRD